MALIQLDYLPGDIVWVVDPDMRVLAATVQGVQASAFSSVPVGMGDEGSLESPYQTTTTTVVPTTTITPTTTISPTTTGVPLVTTTGTPSSSAPPSSSPPITTTTTPPSTPAPEPIIGAADYTIVIRYLVDTVVQGIVRTFWVDEDRVFVDVASATDFVTAELQ